MIERERLGLNVPHEWWASAPVLKQFEAAGFGWAQVTSPPAVVLTAARAAIAHARALSRNLDTTGLRCVLHGPGILAGTREGDRAFEGMLSYAAEAGAGLVVYHAQALPDEPDSEDALLAETRSLAEHAKTAERLGVTIAIENLAPVFPGPELVSASPRTLHTLVRRIGSPALGICLDVGHAQITADARRTDLLGLITSVLENVVLFHIHDNLGVRRTGESRPELDPLRWDLHLAPGRGSIDWDRVRPLISAHLAPCMLEIHPPNRPSISELATIGEHLGEPALA